MQWCYFSILQFFSSRYLFSHKLKGATLAFFVTLACTVLFDLSIAIVAGMALCCVIFTVKCVQHVEVTISEVDPQRLQRINLSYHPRHSSVRVVYISGAIFFGSAGYLERHGCPVRHCPRTTNGVTSHSRRPGDGGNLSCSFTPVLLYWRKFIPNRRYFFHAYR